MKIEFTKMHGCGNDYIYIDGAKNVIDADKKADFVRFVSDRHKGIGSDGVIFINPTNTDASDYEMEMYNADGSRSEMCGNGIRCVARYVYDKGLTDKKKLRIVSGGRVRILDLKTEDDIVTSVRVNMGAPILTPAEIPVSLPDERAMAAKQVINYPIKVMDREYSVTCVSMGNPHVITFVEDPATFPVTTVGPVVECADAFPEKTNVEFASVDGDQIIMRVWERGCGETLACGTGSCATTVAAHITGRAPRKVQLHLLGGTLGIEWRESDNHLYLTGPAIQSFQGTISV